MRGARWISLLLLGLAAAGSGASTARGEGDEGPAPSVALTVSGTFERLPAGLDDALREATAHLVALAGFEVRAPGAEGAMPALSLRVAGSVRSLERAEYEGMGETFLFVSVAVEGEIRLTRADGTVARPLVGTALERRAEETEDAAALRSAYLSATLASALAADLGDLLLPDAARRARYLGRVLAGVADSGAQAAALGALERLPDAAPARDALLAGLDVPPHLADRKARLLASIGGSEVVAALLARLAGSTGESREALVAALADVPGERVARSLVGAFVEQGSTYALERALRRRAPEALSLLLDAAVRPDARVRERAVEGLGHAYAPAAVDAAIRALADPEAGVRWAAVNALGRLDDVRAIPPLVDLARGSDVTRRGALAALGEIEAWDAIDTLLEALGDEDRWVEEDARRALGALSGEDLGDDAAAWRAWAERVRTRATPRPAAPPETLALDLGTPEHPVPMGLVRVPAGRFQMGGGKARSWPSNEPVHEVVLTRPFYVSRTEVTRAQLAALSDPANAAVDGADLPAGGVTFDEAAGFCERLSARTGRRARLPTEAEWEWACRGGTDTAIAYVPGRRADHAWFRPNAGGAPHPVGTKAANGFGLHDMYGNVAEWCADRFGDYVAGRATDPTGPPKGDLCVVRGGSYADGKLLSSDRDAARPDTRRPTLGFRVVIEID